MNFIAQIDARIGEVHALLAKEVLTKAGEAAHLKLSVEIIEQDGKVKIPVDASDQTQLLLISDDDQWQDDNIQQYSGNFKRISFKTLFDNPTAAIPNEAQGSSSQKESTDENNEVKRIVAVTSCPTGIAHTFMAAEGLSVAAGELGYNIRVETQGSVGAGTPLSSEEIAASDLVVIAADREVDRSRFAGKRVYSTGTKLAISDGQALIKEAVSKAKLQSAKTSDNASNETSEDSIGGVYKHLMTGVSYMLPFVVAGGLLIALSFAIGGIHVMDTEGTLGYTLNVIGSQGGFALMVPALAGFIAYSMADRPGIAPGMIGGLIAQQIGAGFLGGIVAGFIAGYAVRLAIRFIILPKSLQGLMPVLVLPLVATAITGLLMVYAVGTPVAAILNFLTEWLKGLQGTNAVILGALIGGMMALDMGGPVNKAAYATSVALISAGIYGPIGAAIIAGMTPPMALALSCWFFPNKFTAEERNSKVSTFVLGLAFISEGAIPFAARDPFRVIPALVIGSAIAGAIAMGMGTGLRAPHGGIFLVFIPGVVINYVGYFLAIIAGTAASTIALGILRKPIAAQAA
ncbi:PTS system, Fru family, IIC component [Bartonella tamiae Th307]|uniref:protein-N(pi)-phosphohistidine--D-fructose phosphotransferase n=2 Tax=Bartonella tamiae TaxID=373638 RepID=J1JXB8_9HYPH|nr:PTS system, Fru family, IIC component [Bartonella tamiae Th239]EJF95578.1 PTS system, Fru family, IIC component [Bartonella tamiae Th307]